MILLFFGLYVDVWVAGLYVAGLYGLYVADLYGLHVAGLYVDACVAEWGYRVIGVLVAEWGC